MAERKDPVTTTGPTSEQIRAEIERTRADMDETFDALEAKLTPGQLLGEAWNLTKGGSTAGAGKLWRIAKEYPMPAAVIGLGLGWLLVESSRSEARGRHTRDRGVRGSYDRYDYAGRSGRYAGSYGYAGTTRVDTDFDAGFDHEPGESEGRLSSAAHTAKEAVSGAAHSAKEAVAGAAASVRDAATGARERAGEVAGRARYRAAELRGQAGAKTRQARLGFWQQMEQNPLAVGTATLALGILAGLTLPSTRKEDELLGETRDRLLEDVRERGQELLDKGRQVAQATVDTVKQVAEEEGLTVENVAEKVRTVGREARHAVTDEAKKQDLVGGPVRQDFRVEETEPELVQR
jgi:hypothetical protein